MCPRNSAYEWFSWWVCRKALVFWTLGGLVGLRVNFTHAFYSMLLNKQDFIKMESSFWFWHLFTVYISFSIGIRKTWLAFVSSQFLFLGFPMLSESLAVTMIWIHIYINIIFKEVSTLSFLNSFIWFCQDVVLSKFRISLP